ncbi:RNA methyltransferase [Glaciihabitans arcticus]|uniref:RNA methyltransferase n=1 Tax=Glaciihabitans arcticus TaxID=2668039 RepID=A0A4Q9GSS5_9MICO|nr:RNA methyltransferase [Glaciihabitans arcticus]TBN56137.1 RNA methyltransferase [Glaciihabitans arcticus]
MIDNPRSPRVRGVAKLAKRDHRLQTGFFLLEGPQAVTEALTYRPELLVELFATPTALDKYPAIASLARDTDLEVEFVTEDVLDSMADTVTPQGIIAVCKQFPTSLKDILADGPKLIAILEEVRDPGNVGTIIRAADAAGADGVILTGRSVDLYNPKVVRATTGSLFHLPVALMPDLESVLDRVTAAGMQVLAADIKGDDLLGARTSGLLAAPTAWLFGNEARGLSDEHFALADRAITVPIYGHAESMNLATAASVCLYESAFAQRS